MKKDYNLNPLLESKKRISDLKSQLSKEEETRQFLLKSYQKYCMLEFRKKVKEILNILQEKIKNSKTDKIEGDVSLDEATSVLEELQSLLMIGNIKDLSYIGLSFIPIKIMLTFSELFDELQSLEYKLYSAYMERI